MRSLCRSKKAVQAVKIVLAALLKGNARLFDMIKGCKVQYT